MTTEQLLHSINRRLIAIERRLRAEDDALLTTSQAAAALGIKPEALRMRAARGTIVCGKSATGRLQFRKSEINKLLTI